MKKTRLEEIRKKKIEGVCFDLGVGMQIWVKSRPNTF